MGIEIKNEGITFQELTGVMRRLRAPGGCPWDREQTFETLRTYIIEEAYELVDAITNQDIEEVMEECGDLLLQPIFIASIAEEKGLFELIDVINTLKNKLIRRHPHVFADVDVENSDQVVKNWESIKSIEKKENTSKKDTSVLSGVPGSLPGLVKAYRIQEKAANVGFDWPKGDTTPLFSKVSEEIGELKEALYNGIPADIEDEMGDLFFAMVNLARHLDLNPEIALQKACSKFEKRFRSVEKRVNTSERTWDGYTLKELDGLWENSKRELADETGSDDKGGVN